MHDLSSCCAPTCLLLLRLCLSASCHCRSGVSTSSGSSPTSFVKMAILHHPLTALLLHSSSSRNDFSVNHHFRWILVIIEILPRISCQVLILLVASDVRCAVHCVRGWDFGESVLCAVALFVELGLEHVFHGLRKGFSSLGRDYGWRRTRARDGVRIRRHRTAMCL
jgi:hypothetical protein